MEALSELGKNLVEHSLNISSRVRCRFHPCPSNSIRLINEENSRSRLSRQLEDFLHVLSRLAKPFRYYLVALYLEKTGLLASLADRSRYGLRHVGLSRPRWTEEEYGPCFFQHPWVPDNLLAPGSDLRVEYPLDCLSQTE